MLARLYSEIYYPSNHEIELGASVLSNAVPLSDCNDKKSMSQEHIQNKFKDKVNSEFEVTRGKYNKAMVYNEILHLKYFIAK